VLHYFHSLAAPSAGVIFDGAGNLYGSASGGGPSDGGAIFKLAPQPDGRWAYSVLRFFFGKPAEIPFGNLVLDKVGNLYGTTLQCGSGCAGIVFEITP
jgi:uncharacterized repeat protein (TIGR03803 family)